jgi:hypothetical protein
MTDCQAAVAEQAPFPGGPEKDPDADRLAQEVAAERRERARIVINPEQRVAENVDFLRSMRPLGGALVEPYLDAVQANQLVARASLRANVVPFFMIAYTKNPWTTATGETEVYLPLGRYGRLFAENSRREAVRDSELMAEMLGMPVEYFDQVTHQIFTALHECSHVVDHEGYTGTVGEFSRQHDEDNRLWNLAANLSGRAELDEVGDEVLKNVMQNWHALSSRFGVKSVRELHWLGKGAHRRIPEEAKADQFAASLMRGKYV